MNPFDFMERVVIVCVKHRGSVSSWGRTSKHNEEVGGVMESSHLLWLGCDVVLDEMVINERFEKDCKVLGLVVFFEGDHYHVQGF
jgi:hypothetical protein